MNFSNIITYPLGEIRTFIARFILGLLVALAPLSGYGQGSSSPSKKRLCIGPVVSINSVMQKAKKADQWDTLQQVLETLDTTLVDQVNASRKFDVVARKAALQSLIEEQEFGASGNIDPSTAAQALMLVGAEYLVITTVTDFVMGTETLKFEGIGTAANREAVRINCSIQIYDSTTGKLIESARFRGQQSSTSRDGSPTAVGVTLSKITDSVAENIVNRIIDVIYPAKVVAVLGSQVTINRGEGTGVAIGQNWSVFGLGDEIIDPDTGEKLGGNEAEVGQFKIVRVTAKLSYGESIEDNGIAVGNITRPMQHVEAEDSNSPSTTQDPAEKYKNDF